jgi:hypothetical protein
MSGQTRHPGTEALADFRAGHKNRLSSRKIAAHLAECQDCSSVSDRLGQVSTVLAAIPAPSLPDEVERRITAAISAEAGLRGRQAGAPAISGPLAISDLPGSPGEPEPVDRPRRAPRRGWSRRVPLYPGLKVPLSALIPAAACLLLAIVGYAVSGGPGPAPSPVAGGRGATPQVPRSSSAGAVVPGVRPHTLGPAMRGPAATFVVTASGTNYLRATLGTQVRQQLTGSPSAQPGADETQPSGALVGCVYHVTSNVKPSLVDHATYDSRPVYVIAVPGRVWVVSPSCTAADPGLIMSAPLSQLP